MARLKVALSHDVDRVQKTHQYLTRSLRRLSKGDLQGLWHELKSYSKRKEVYWNFPEIMKTEAELGVRSTFFFLQESYPFRLLHPSSWKLALGRYDIRTDTVAAIIRELDQGGWEIGLHGSYNSYQELALLKTEKEQLEQIVGHPIIGVRQHYLNLNEKTWEYQVKAGFKYDSSVGFADRIGYKGQQIAPFKPEKYPLIEFPLALMDSCYMEDQDKAFNLKKVIEQTREADGILVLNWHSNSWNPGEYPGYSRNYIDIIHKLQAEGAIFRTLGEYYLDITTNLG